MLRPETGVAIGYGLGKEASYRDVIFGVATWLGFSSSRHSYGVATEPGLGRVMTCAHPARNDRAPVRAVCVHYAHNPPTAMHSVVHCLDHSVEHRSRVTVKKKSTK